MKMRPTIFTAFSSFLFLVFAQFAGATAEAQQVPDPRVADLVQAGKIRVGVHSVMYTKDPQTGELKAASTGIILLDIARALGARIGVEIVPVGHPTIPEMLTCLTAGACDMGFMGPDPSRAGVDFSPPILQLDYTFLVPAGVFDPAHCGRRPTGRSHRCRERSRLDLDLEPNTQTRPTGVCGDSGPHFRAPAYRTSGRVCLSPRRASGVFGKASRLAGAGRALRGQPPRHGGAEGSSRAARLHQRIYRTGQGLGIGAAGDRARRLARIQGGTGKDKLKRTQCSLDLRPLWVKSGHVQCNLGCPLMCGGFNRSTQHSISFFLLGFESQGVVSDASDLKVPVCSAAVKPRKYPRRCQTLHLPPRTVSVASTG